MSALDRARAPVHRPADPHPARTARRRQARDSSGGWQPPLGRPATAAADAAGVRRGDRGSAASGAATPRGGRSRAAPDARRRGARGRMRRVEAAVASTACGALPSRPAAVLGRPGEVEPVAAALALALRRETRSKAATVVVVGATGRGGGERRRSGAAAGGTARGARSRGAGSRAARLGRGSTPTIRNSSPRSGASRSSPRRRCWRSRRRARPRSTRRSASRTCWSSSRRTRKVRSRGSPRRDSARPPLTTLRPLGRGPARSLARAGVRAPRARAAAARRRRARDAARAGRRDGQRRAAGGRRRAAALGRGRRRVLDRRCGEHRSSRGQASVLLDRGSCGHPRSRR